MTQFSANTTVLGPILLLACLLLPSRRTSLCRSIGSSLPWVVFGVSLLTVIELVLTGAPILNRVTLAEGGPFADLTFVLLDQLSVTLLVLVSFLGAIIARYARNYMAGEPREGYFYKWLCVTIGSVLCVILSGNLLLFTLAWMATSLSLHKLLVFYPDRPAARLAARKKFIISRVGDLSLAAAMVWTGGAFGTLDFPSIFAQAEAVLAGTLIVPSYHLHAIALLLALGALLKSAQFPFHTWLPDTLETPTPVSALMHAGIINAGGYLIVRLSPLMVLSTLSLTIIAIVGAFTAVFAGLVMLTQTSVKKSLAFSTVAQMGFMMLQCGLGAFSLAVLHIVAHSLYKAHAFLNSGELPARHSALRPPGVTTLLASFALALAAFVGMKSVGGGLQGENGYAWILGFVVALGLMHFAAHGLARAGALWTRSGLRVVATVVVLSTTYALLHSGSRALLGDSVASAPQLTASGQAFLYGGIAVLFGIGFAIPLLAARHAFNPLLRRVYMHASHGFYCNTFLNRLLQKAACGPSVKRPYVRRPPVTAPDFPADAVEKACGRLAPLWPLEHFVAVNPYLGYSGVDFVESAHHLNRVVDAEPVPELNRFRQLLLTGKIGGSEIGAALESASDHLKSALTEGGIAPNAEAVRAAALDPDGPRSSASTFSSFAAFYDQRLEGYWQRFITEDISRRCAAYFDEAQAAWRFPYERESLFAAWKQSMPDDHNADLAGIMGFRAAVAHLPDHPPQVIRWALYVLRVPPAVADDFLYAQLFSIRGWAGYCQYLRHDAELIGNRDDNIVDLLAIRLAYDAFLFQAKANGKTAARWFTHLDSMVLGRNSVMPPELALRCLLLDAFERSRRAPLFEQLTAAAGEVSAQSKARPKLQSIFCIDVRSEIYRRSLEAQSDAIETIGFAGFFGIPVRYEAQNGNKPTARCPVLLAPNVDVSCATAAHPTQQIRAWKAFQKDAPSCFPYVETIGLGFAWKTLQASFPGPRTDGFAAAVAPGANLDSDTRSSMAACILTNLGLKDNFAEFILFAGHGSHSTNNPHASGLDCGACGGHAGDINALIAAALLNDAEVRAELGKSHRIEIPKDTRFLAGLHNTTTDAVTLFEDPDLSPEQREVLPQLRTWLDAASASARMLRAPQLGIKTDARSHHRISRRAVDWSQTRPEWGLAGNFAFIAAPRERTQALNLEGRAFLHNYDATRDPEGKVLSLILTAPVVVASWINLQYYGSTVDNARFGAGSKVIHNIAAGIGVLAGNGGDLQTGLPLQSLATSDHEFHEPLRLHVCVEAAPEAIDKVLSEQGSIRELVENRWLHLFAITDGGTGLIQRHPSGNWEFATTTAVRPPCEVLHSF